MSESRPRRPRSPSPEYKLDYEDEQYTPYIPVAKRRQDKLAKLTSWGVKGTDPKLEQKQREEREDALREEEVLRERQRKGRTLLVEAQEVHQRKAEEGEELVAFRADPVI